MKKSLKQAGFTLIELTLVIVLISIIAIVSTQMLSQGLTASKTGQDVIGAAWQGQIALERMARDIRAIRTSADISTASSSALTFTDSSGNSIAYALSGSSLTRNSQILADGIASMTLSYFDENGGSGPTTANIRYVTISLNVTQNDANYTVQTSVYPRNLP